jgi:SAM-dependent methyltransferase
MYPDVVDLREFYESELGGLVRRLLRAPLRRLWDNTSKLVVVGLGYATPHLRMFSEEAERSFAFMPAQQGVTWWPREGPNATALTEETAWPMEDASVDRLLVVHALENSERMADLLNEAWRVLAANGRMIVIVPHRGGFWTMSQKTPFGYGFSFTLAHIRRTLTHYRFQVERHQRALFVPPFMHRFLAPYADWIEKYFAMFLPALAGVLVVEVTKQVYARPQRERVKVAKSLLSLPEFLPSAPTPTPTAGRMQ